MYSMDALLKSVCYRWFVCLLRCWQQCFQQMLVLLHSLCPQPIHLSSSFTTDTVLFSFYYLFFWAWSALSPAAGILMPTLFVVPDCFQGWASPSSVIVLHTCTLFFPFFFVGPKKINFLVVLLHASCGVYLFPLLFLIFLGVQYWLVLPPPHRSMEFSLYQETSDPQMQEVTPKEPSADPGTLVWSSSSTHAHINALHTQKQCSFTWTPIYYSKN